MKKLVSVLLCAIVLVSTVFAFAGCTKTQDLKYDVALITDGGSIHDKGYNQSAWEGIQSYAEAENCKATYYQPALEEDQELSTELIEQYVKLAADKGVKYIVFPGEDFAVAAYELASAYPDVNFLLLDAFAHSQDDSSVRLLPNVMNVNFDELQGGYLAGYSAVLLGNTKLGYFGSVQSEQSSNYGAGFVQGAAAAADAAGIPVTLDYADYDSALLDFDYSVHIQPVYDKIENAAKPCRKVVVENGYGSGTYVDGQNVTVYCDAYNSEGQKFDHWEVKSNTEGVKDKKVNVSSKKKEEINLIVGDCDCTLTAVYTDTEEKVCKVSVSSADGKAVYKDYFAAADSTVWVSAPPAEKGMVFDYWTTSGREDGIEDKNAASTNVTAEADEITLTPVYKVSTEPTFEVTVENGTGSGSYLPGDIVHVVANPPEDGYYFEKWSNADTQGNSTGIAMENEFYYDTEFEMVDRYAAIAETMVDMGDKLLFAGGNEKAASLYTAKEAFDLSDISVVGSGIYEDGAYYSVVKEYGAVAAACLKNFKGASIYNADCSVQGITCALPEVDNKDELQKQMDAVYTQLAEGTVQPVSVAPGADVRLSFKSSCLSLNYWIYKSVDDAKQSGATVIEAED